MTDRIINPQNQINFGGVRVNQNEIASKKVVKENGATRYIINFKNGTTIKYPAQKKTNNTTIQFNPSQKPTQKNIKYMEVTNLAYGEITGSPNEQDNINMWDCKSCKIDLSNDNNKDRVTLLDDVDIHKRPSQNNQIKMGKEDETDISYDHILVKGEGLHKEGQE